MLLPNYGRTATATPTKLPKGLDALAHGAEGWWRRQCASPRALQREALQIIEAAAEWRNASNDALGGELRKLRAALRRRPEALLEMLPKALAAVYEAAARKTGLRAHPEQIMAALAIARGHLVEMATGEGKTLSIALAAVPAGWTGRPCHIITANDYLAQRDANGLSHYYEFCGLQTGFVAATMAAPERQRGYACDLTYTTAKEVVADFLRDRLQAGALLDPGRRLVRQMRDGMRGDFLVMRGLHTAIVDEADNGLIDEAVTPLIISRKQANAPLTSAAQLAAEIARELRPGEDYIVDLRHKEIRIKPEAAPAIQERGRNLPGMWNGVARRQELVRLALQAREFYIRDRQYVVQKEELVIVDEFTGRLMPQRTWAQGLHQAVEAKEGLPISPPSETLARLSFQRYFRLYHRLAGVTGTGREAGGEFWQIYRLPVITIPHHRPCIRREERDRIFATQEEKWMAVVEEAAQMHAQGRPILIGTRNVAASEHVAGLLRLRGLPISVLNATRHEQEAAIIGLAGERGRITIATNMAGRGSDIKLAAGVADLGGLHVIATERHESRRIDRQLFGRCARQGDPGSAQAFVSLEDELLRRYVPEVVLQRVRKALAAGLPGAALAAARAISFAQKASERAAFRQRANVLKYDTWLEKSLGFAGPGAG